MGYDKRTVKDIVPPLVKLAHEGVYHIAFELYAVCRIVNTSYLLRVTVTHRDHDMVAHRRVLVSYRQPVISHLLRCLSFEGLIEVKYLTALLRILPVAECVGHVV